MTGFIENGLLKLAGLSEADIATLNARLPDLLNLIRVAKAHVAQLTRVINDLEPIAERLISRQMELGK